MDALTNPPALDARGERLFPLLLAVVSAFVIFYGLGRPDITTANEGQRGTPPIEMLQTGDFIIPTLNRHVYIVKPPLLYWVIAGLYRVTGVVNEATARTPTALSGVALLLGVYFFARRSIGERAARWAALVLLSMPFFLRRCQVSDLDMPLTLACFGAIVALWSAMDGGPRRWAMTAAAGAAVGAAILLKGPVPFFYVVTAWAVHMVVRGERGANRIRTGLAWTAILFAGDWLVNGVQLLIPAEAPALLHRVLSPPYGLIGVVALWLWFAWRWGPADRARRVAVLAGVLLIGASLAAPWFAASVYRLGWDYWRELLHHEAIDRTYHASQINSGSHVFYVIGLAYCMAPWSLLVPMFASTRLRVGAPPLWTASSVAALVSVTIFSLIAGKEQDYVLPAYPFAAIAFGGLLASAAEAQSEGWTALYRRRWWAVSAAALGVGAVGVAVYVSRTYTGELAPRVEVWIGVATAVLALGLFRARGLPIAGLTAATVALLMQLHALDGARWTGRNSIQDVALAMRGLRERGLRAEASEVRPEAAFYIRTPIPIVEDPRTVAERLRGPEPYYYFCRVRELEDLRAAAGTSGFEVLADRYARGRNALIGNRALPEGVGSGLLVGPDPE